MRRMLSMIGASILCMVATAMATPPPPTATKLPADLGKEMADAVVAVNKVLGLESWAAHGDQPCIDRGGLGATAKDVGVDETRTCAASAVDHGLPALGKSYVLAILMADIGPVTVVAFGTGAAAGWGAYSCDPGRKCPPTKLDADKKWGKRLIERRAKACAQSNTIWFPADQRACEGATAAPIAPTAPAAPTAPTTPTGPTGPAAPTAPTAPAPVQPPAK
jgi:hypothetical protein